MMKDIRHKLGKVTVMVTRTIMMQCDSDRKINYMPVSPVFYLHLIYCYLQKLKMRQVADWEL